MTSDNPASSHLSVPPSGRTGTAASRFASAFLWSVTILLLITGLALRWRLYDRQPLDFDEYLHLHLGWCWSQGQLPGIDYWDNRLPLLHLMLAALQSVGGDGPATVFLARKAMLAISLTALAATYLLARTAFDKKTGWAAVALLACVQLFTEKTAEVRPDAGLVLFAVIAVICVLKARAAGTARAGAWLWFAGGAAFGLAVLLSTRALMLVPALAIARAVLAWRKRERRRTRPLLIQSSMAALGLSIAAGPLLIYLASRGVLADLLRFSIFDNLRFPDRVPPMRWLWPSWSTPMVLVFVGGALQAVVGQFRRSDLRDPQLLLLLIAAALVTQFALVMPSPYAHSACLFIPFLAVLGGHLLRTAIGRVGEASRHRLTRLVGGGIALAILLAGMGDSLLRLQLAHMGDRAALDRQLELVEKALAVTGPGDAVFADTPIPIFRRHACFYPALWEGVVHRFARGRIQPPIREQLRRSGCTLIVRTLPSRTLPVEDQAFIEDRFVSYAASLLVPGQRYPADRFAQGPVVFDAVTAGRYTIRSATPVLVDGLATGNEVFYLTAGPHNITRSAPVGEVTILRQPGQ
jgi:4-amino-4-deoxy-L-arabinose transferase-like glycosyltransferase